MLGTKDLLLLFSLIGAASGLYKQWIPNTNYENETNWDKGTVPCGNDRVEFLAQRKVSVFVETVHAVQEMRLPIDGEFILNPGAGFYVISGKDPSCGAGVTANFRDSESLQWYDPALWQAAATSDDLHGGNLLFAVHEESVPCRHDDVVFAAGTSFRVDTSSSESTVPVKTVSLLGKKFDDGGDFSQHLGSRLGQLQFHGSSAVTVGYAGCQDPSGCDCGNSVNHQRICQAVTCASASCQTPLRPVGHCCHICGAIVTVRYADGFSLETYRQRLRHLFLSMPQYKSIRLGMSKVFRSRHLFGVVPFGLEAEIQVVLLDGDHGTLAESLAEDIVKDANAHSSNLGITAADFRASSGSGSSNNTASSAGTVVGIVFGLLIVISLAIVLALLIRKGVVKRPTLPSLPSLPSLSFTRSRDVGELGGTLDLGYDNPMFNKPSFMPEAPGLYGTEGIQSIAMTQTGVHFVNPVYDEHDGDFTV